MASMLRTGMLIGFAWAVTLVSPLTATAEEAASAELAQAEAQMIEAFGKVPSWLAAYPEHARVSAWKWFGDMTGPEGPIPGKYVQLIALAVAAQIPCEYCTYGHTEFGTQFYGATEEELRHAVSIAADVRHWSTVLRGAGVDPADFKVEIDGIVDHIQAKSAAAQEASE